MRYLKNLKFILASLLFVLVASCDDEDTVPMPTGMEDSFDLAALNNSGVSGTITFEEANLGATIVTIALNGTISGNSHPTHIHVNSAAEGGDIAVSLNPVDGETGMSETYVETRDNGTNITYEELMNFDGYVNVHLSADDLATVVAQGDIGSNELTDESYTYELETKDVPNVDGIVTFNQRKDGSTLAEIMMNGTVAGGSHPGHIHENAAIEGGGIAVSLLL